MLAGTVNPTLATDVPKNLENTLFEFRLIFTTLEVLRSEAFRLQFTKLR